MQLAEQDPLIAVRQDGSVLSVSLYGEVQKEVIGATLAAEYGVVAEFRDTETDLRRAPSTQRRGARADPRRVEPIRRDDGISRRACARRLGCTSSR